MSADGILTNMNQVPEVEVRCYECSNLIYGPPSTAHPDCVKDGTLRYTLELVADHQET